MSAFRPKARGTDSRDIRKAYLERKVARMMASGSAEDHARSVLMLALAARKDKREQRRRAGEFIRRERGEYEEELPS